MTKIIKVYVLVEQFENDYRYTDGYVNCVFASKEQAVSAGNMLSKGQKAYSFKVLERELSLDIEATVNLKVS